MENHVKIGAGIDTTIKNLKVIDHKKEVKRYVSAIG